MRHFMKQFGPALKLPWTKLEAPDLTEALIENMVAGTDEQLGGASIREMERLRDDCLIDIMRALSKYREGAGRLIAEREEAGAKGK